jgi:hypothetical protein
MDSISIPRDSIHSIEDTEKSRLEVLLEGFVIHATFVPMCLLPSIEAIVRCKRDDVDCRVTRKSIIERRILCRRKRNVYAREFNFRVREETLEIPVVIRSWINPQIRAIKSELRCGSLKANV